MTIKANLADGTVMNFPDGTDPGVIEETVKKYISGNHSDGVKLAIKKLTERGKITPPYNPQKMISDTYRKESMDELAGEIGPVQSFFINMGEGLYDVGRGLGIAEPADQSEKEAMGALREARPYTSGAGEIVGQALPFLPLGMGAGSIASLPLRMAASGVVGGVEGGILSKGSGENVGTGIGIGAGIGVGAEILFPVLGRLGRKIFQRVTGRVPKGAILDAVGNPTPEFQEALDAMGISFNDLKDDAVELITKQKPGANAEQTARASMFKEEGVSPTTGEVTKDFRQQATEQRLLESSQDTAAEPFRQFKLKQSEAIKKKMTDELGLGLGGKEETGNLIHDVLMGRKNLLRTQKNELYKTATENAKEIGGVPIFTDNLKEAMPDADLFEDLAITAEGPMKALNQILTKYGIKDPTEEMLEKGFEPTQLTIENFERFRKTLQRISRGDNTGAVSVATRPITEALDRELAELGTIMADQGVPDNIIKPLIDARKTVVALKTEYSPQSIVGRIVDTKKDGVTQVIEASKIYDKLIGRASPVEDTRKLVKSLTRRFGNDGQQALAALQTTTMMDLIDAGFGTASRTISGIKIFNPIAFKNRIKAIGPDKLKALFANEKLTLKKLNNIEKIAGELVPPSGAVPKGSASVILDLANKLGLTAISHKMPGGAFLMGALKTLGDPIKTGRAVREAVKGMPEVEPMQRMIEQQFSGIASALGIAVTITPEEKK